MAIAENEFPNLALIREGINYRFPVTLRKLTLMMRPLSTMEEDRISQTVIDEMKKLPTENQTTLKQSALLSIKKLALAQTTDVYSKDIQMNEVELQMLSPGELEYLFKCYIAECDKVNTGIEKFYKEELKLWAEALKKNTQNLETTLTESSFYQLVALSLHLLTTSESPEAS
jgi:hypothetical protein